MIAIGLAAASVSCNLRIPITPVLVPLKTVTTRGRVQGPRSRRGRSRSGNVVPPRSTIRENVLPSPPEASWAIGTRVTADEGTGTIQRRYSSGNNIKIALDDGARLTNWIPTSRVRAAEPLPYATDAPSRAGGRRPRGAQGRQLVEARSLVRQAPPADEHRAERGRSHAGDHMRTRRSAGPAPCNPPRHIE